MATLYKIKNTYYINWSESGKRHRKVIGRVTKDKANNILARLVAELVQRKFDNKPPRHKPTTTLKQFSTNYLNWRKSEFPASQDRTRQAMHNHLLPEFGDTPMIDISVYQVEQWKIHRRDTAAPATIKKELDVLKAALNKAVEWEIIPKHRITAVSPPTALRSRPPRYYSKDELQAIYDNSIKYGDLWKFMANTGIRRGEIMRARREHIVNDVIRIVSTEDGRTKSGKWRPVPLGPGAMDALPGLGKDYLAPQIYLQSLSRAFVNDAKEVGGSIHCLRHTFCSQLVMAGVDLRTVQELAGHKSYETTLKYSHLSNPHLQKAVSELSL